MSFLTLRRPLPAPQSALRKGLAVLLLAVARAGALAADASTAEYQIKAAFVCKFGNYVEWPAADGPRADGAFVIGVLASDVIAEAVTRAAAAHTVNGRAIVVRRPARGEPLDALAIVFVARTHAARLAEVLAAARGQPILTVTESDEPANAGVVNFVVVEDKVRFDIALQPAEASNLKISGRLLAVARKVSGRPP